ncbi:xanthine dehydrogenase family protein molybdopterin-binding subunit [Leptolinea tardivitalis]|nr:xanthine dehydrogenase family protein molybdopterin-binding subunit [Leptolinea tardivitalis]GAP22466.1 aerobic-type carbon monoxide dehydrogenase, large subunit CoxL/CutL homolog [Leptolinea tardivitalis]
MTDRQFIGKPTNRVDALEKVMGTARYTADYYLPGMLISRCLRSKVPHARIISIDTSEARQIPGVHAVITCDDFIDHGRFGFPIVDMYMLAYQRVRYVGDPIAAVAAENEESLQAALKAIKVELEPLPGLFDPRQALSPDAPLVGEKPRDAEGYPHGNLLIDYIVRQNDPDAVWKECDLVLDKEYTTMHQEHAYIETEASLAVPWPKSSGVTVYACCQSPFLAKNNIIQTVGLGSEDVRVIQPYVGGAFGGKDDTMYQTIAQTAKLALISGRPVKMVFSREESMISSYKRDAMIMHYKIGAKKDGTLMACQFHGIVDSGAYAAITPFTAWRSTIHAMGPYRYQACSVDTDVVYTNNGFAGAFRGFGNTEVCFASELAVDEIAYRLNMDPIDLRLKNCLRPGDTTSHGQKLGDDVALAECLQQVRKLSDWDRKRKEFEQGDPARIHPGELRKGIGVAAVFHGMSLGAEGKDSAVGTLRINDDNTLTLTSGLTDYGSGSRTVFTLIAAETLGINPSRIHMLRPDTDTAIDSGPTVASRATVLGGNATQVTAMRLDAILLNAAADLFHCQIVDILRDGENYIGPNEEPASFDKVVDHARQMGLTLSTEGRWNAPENHWSFESGTGKPYFAYHFGAQVAEVLVDTGTGKVEVTGYWGVHNTGTVIFPQGILGQLYGGITQGLGYALMERVDFDKGFIQATNFDEYIIPTAMDVPEIVGAFVEKPFSDGPYGAKNIAEPSLVPAAPAIINAIFHATGRRIQNLPANLERVLIGKDLRKEGSNTACKLGLHQV